MKNQFKHTPAPWVFSGETSSLFGHVKIGTHELTINTPPESRERIANAKLIAAAPELLEALEETLDLAVRYSKRVWEDGGADAETALRLAKSADFYKKAIEIIKKATE